MDEDEDREANVDLDESDPRPGTDNEGYQVDSSDCPEAPTGSEGDQIDSDRYQVPEFGSEGDQIVSDRCQVPEFGSEGDQIDSDRYQVPEFGSAGYENDSAGYRSDNPFAIAAPQQSADGPRDRTDAPPPGGWLPVEALATESMVRDDGDRPRPPSTKQIGVRLRWDQFARLEEAAKLCGIAPTTMAKVLINRGALAIVEERHKDLVRFSREG